jgi:hypothetical protein
MANSAAVDAAIGQIIEGTLAEGKAVGVAGAGMTLNNIARYQDFVRRGVQLLSTGAPEMIRSSGGDFLAALRG